MDVINASHLEEKSEITMVRTANAELVNPIEKRKSDIINMNTALRLSSFQFAFKHGKPSPIGKVSMEYILNFLEKEGLTFWQECYDEIMQVNLPDTVFKILNCDDKNIQVKTLKSPFEFTSLSFQKFSFLAWELHGFKYSEYRFEHPQKGLDTKDLPTAFFLDEDDGSPKVFGSTSLKSSILKNAIKHRKVTIAKFLDKDSEWHCFYYTYNSINGNEAGDIPHIHYISNNWTINRKIVLEELSKRHHSFTSSVHVKYRRNS
ncbi:MAG: hypothetical protein GXC78_07440 [Chitinophagaceae bacterium]|nr:hypothetical protein [Chitinophagaceae bacterium]